jgi:hypothetical protein
MIDLRLFLVGLALGTLMVAVATLLLVSSVHNDSPKIRGVNPSSIFDGKGTAILATLSLILLSLFLVMFIWILR